MLTFLILELLLRFLPVNEGSYLLPVNEINHLVRFQPNRTFIWTSGWKFNIVNKVNINNDGFINDINYDKNLTIPLIAVIGDSYVEAIMVPFRKSVTGRLAKHLGNSSRVYSFAHSGAPLSQYLIYAEYAQTTFKANGMIIVVIANDFDESFWKYSISHGHHFFVEKENGEIVLERKDVSVSLTKKIARKSALARYLALNVGVKARLHRLRKLIMTKDDSEMYVAHTSIDVNIIRVDDAKRAIDTFFDKLPTISNLDPSNILFVLDGIRPELYSDDYDIETETSYIGIMRKYFIASAKIRDYEIIDMQSRFIDHHKKHGKRFEYPTDWHWNELGHKVIFEAITQSKFLMRLIKEENDS
jgi:hypothetical protein